MLKSHPGKQCGSTGQRSCSVRMLKKQEERLKKVILQISAQKISEVVHSTERLETYRIKVSCQPEVSPFML